MLVDGTALRVVDLVVASMIVRVRCDTTGLPSVQLVRVVYRLHRGELFTWCRAEDADLLLGTRRWRLK